MELKPGYKRTDVAVIPEDWEMCTIQELIDRGAIIGHLDGNHGELYPRSHEFQESGVPYVSANDFNGHKVSFNSCKYLTEERARRFRKGIAKNGDVLFAHNATVGPTALLSTELDYVILSTTATYFRCNSEKLINSFVLYMLQASCFVRQYRAVMTQSTRNQVPITAQRKLFVVLPSTKVEQEAIAKALSDMDDLIEALEHLILKKRRIKVGATQKLLFGKNRLPGFDDEWKTHAMSYYFEPVGTRNTELNDNVVTISAQLGFVRQEEFFKKRVASKVLENYYLIERGDFAYNRSYSNGYPFGAIKRLTKYDKGVVTTLYICFRLKSNTSADPAFFEHYFEAGLLNPGLATVTNEGGRAHGLLNITKADFFTREVTCPCLSEQVAIAAVLSDLNAEIEALEEKLVKARQLKQGMMQELLTGRIRLI